MDIIKVEAAEDGDRYNNFVDFAIQFVILIFRVCQIMLANLLCDSIYTVNYILALKLN